MYYNNKFKILNMMIVIIVLPIIFLSFIGVLSSEGIVSVAFIGLGSQQLLLAYNSYKLEKKSQAFIFLVVSILSIITGLGAYTSNVDSPEVNSSPASYTEVSKFAKENYDEYMNKLDIQSYDVTETSIAARAGYHEHFICVIESNIVKEQDGKREKLTYGFNIIKKDNGDFEVLNQGIQVDNTYLQNDYLNSYKTK